MEESELVSKILSGGIITGIVSGLGLSLYYLVNSIKKGNMDEEYLKKQELIEAERQYWDSFICS